MLSRCFASSDWLLGNCSGTVSTMMGSDSFRNDFDPEKKTNKIIRKILITIQFSKSMKSKQVKIVSLKT